jgi:hypothetical protein
VPFRAPFKAQNSRNSNSQNGPVLRGKATTKRERTAAESYLFSTDKLRSKLNKAMGHANFQFSNGRPITSGSLIQFLYKIDFITARLKLVDGSIDRKYFSEGRFLAPEFADFGYDWEIHPAYRWALQPQDIQSVLDDMLN